MRGAPAAFATPSSGNSASQDRSTYGCTLTRSHTSAALNSARFGMAIGTVSGISRRSFGERPIIRRSSAGLPPRLRPLLDVGLRPPPHLYSYRRADEPELLPQPVHQE